MHISDGVLPTFTVMGGIGLAGVGLAISAYKLDSEDIPRIAVMSAAFFVASLIHVKGPGTSVHLLLHGLVGIVLGLHSILAITMGLLLQFLLFGHGGISTIGVNACLMGLPAILVGLFYPLIGQGKSVSFRVGLASILSGLCVVVSALLASWALFSAGREFAVVAGGFLLSHIPIIFIEGAVAGIAVSFLLKVKPEILPCSKAGLPVSS